MYKNLLVRLEDETMRRATFLAARRSTSVSRLVADVIERLVRDGEAYEQARIEALADLASGHDLGSAGQLPLREEAYER